MILSESVQIRRLDDKDEVEVCAVGITVRNVASANCVRPRFDHFSHLVVHLWHVVPIDRTLERVDDDAVILNGVAKVRIGESAVFPRRSDVTREVESVILSCDLADISIDISLKSALAVAEAEEQASRVLFVSFCGKNRFKRRADDAVHMRHHIRFLCVRKTECRRVSELALHNLSHNRHTVFPRGEHKREFFVLFAEVEHFEGDLGENAEAAFASHHNLIDIGARCFSGRSVRFDDADRCNVFLFEHEVCRATVIS